jgi:putative SOS response-associated peptidase YedK
MCGRYVSATPVEELAQYFAAEPDPDLGSAADPRYNVPPTELVLGVVEEPPRRDAAVPPDPADPAPPADRPAEVAGAAAGEPPSPRRIRAYRWGLVPPWAKDLSAGNRAFNARAESVATKPAFRAAFRSRRLLVPATAFYEWRRAGGRRQPFAFRRSDGEPLAFAGLWERWKDPETGVWIRSLTIITTDAGPDVAAVHDRQPVVVEPADFERWLTTPAATKAEVGELEGVLAPSPAGTLVSFEVDPAVGSTANDSPRLFEPYEHGDEPVARASGSGSLRQAAGR